MRGVGVIDAYASALSLDAASLPSAASAPVRVAILDVNDDGVVTLEIEDDGHGFDVTTVKPSKIDGRGFGLLGMRERVELLGGTFALESSPGEGTRIVITIPVEREET